MHLESTERKYTGNNICSIENEENGLDQVIDVYFDAFQKRYYFLNNPKFSVEINDQVIVETQMGLAIGKVVSLKKAAMKSNGEALKMIIRVATKKDIEKNNELKINQYPKRIERNLPKTGNKLFSVLSILGAISLLLILLRILMKTL